MARKRTTAALMSTAMTPQQNEQAASSAEAPTPRYSTRATRGMAAPPPVYAELESSDDEDHQPTTTNGKAKLPARPEQDSPIQGTPTPRYNTRYKEAQLLKQSQDADGEEEVPREDYYPLYKDDLPNAFNGAVDPNLDFISKAPNEVIDNVLSYLVLDHHPDRGVKIKSGTYKPVPHVLLSMASMSRSFYHATEDFARRYRTRNKLDLPVPGVYWPQHPEVFARLKASREREQDRERSKRRSVRIANTPKPEIHEAHRKALCVESRCHCVICHKPGWRPGKLANHVTVCEDCERSAFGVILTLTEAMKRFDLRDYMLIKSRTPGPRAKFLDLPSIPYGSEHKPMGFPIFNTVTVFSFCRSDVQMIAQLVHGDVKKHLRQKEEESRERRAKARRKRVRDFKIRHCQEKVEISTGAVAKRHAEGLERQLALDPDDEDEDNGTDCFCGLCRWACCYDEGLCEQCGDVPGYGREWCDTCETVWIERRYDQFYNRST